MVLQLLNEFYYDFGVSPNEPELPEWIIDIILKVADSAAPTFEDLLAEFEKEPGLDEAKEDSKGNTFFEGLVQSREAVIQVIQT